jgi:hypothetical protein
MPQRTPSIGRRFLPARPSSPAAIRIAEVELRVSGQPLATGRGKEHHGTALGLHVVVLRCAILVSALPWTKYLDARRPSVIRGHGSTKSSISFQSARQALS